MNTVTSVVDWDGIEQGTKLYEYAYTLYVDSRPDAFIKADELCHMASLLDELAVEPREQLMLNGEPCTQMDIIARCCNLMGADTAFAHICA